MINVTELSECLCCGHNKVNLILDLHDQPLANSFKLNADDSEDVFPLKLNLCPNCTHLQLSHAVNPDLLFKHYLYVSGTSQTYMKYMDWYAQWTLAQYKTHSDKTAKSVLDIGCNDGSQLDAFAKVDKQLTTHGVDPAENLFVLSTTKGHDVRCGYWNESMVADLIKHKSTVDIISTQNVFAHTSYPLKFLQMCKEIMHDDSVMFVQTSQADMVRNNEFDTIYHEHLSFFNASSMQALASRAGLNLVEITKTPIHGNSYVFVFSKTATPSANVKAVLQEEMDVGLQKYSTYEEYAVKCCEAITNLKETVRNYRGDGYVIAGYGAAAKGNTLLNFGEIQLDFIIDDNPLKQDLFTPGTSIPVLSIDILKEVEDMQVVFIPLAWNLFNEIRTNIKKVRNKEGDVFVRYFPAISIES